MTADTSDRLPDDGRDAACSDSRRALPPIDSLHAAGPTPNAARRKLRLPQLLVVVSVVLAGVAYGALRYQSTREADTAPLQRTPRNAPFITSPDYVVNKMIEMAGITQRDLVYDLGCGDGRIVVTAAVQRGCRGVGFDIDPQRVAEATDNARKHGVEHLVAIEQRDVFQVDLSKANVIVMYLLPWMIEKLTPQLEKLPPGTRIVSHDFKITDAEDQQVAIVTRADDKQHSVWMYVTPLKRTSRPVKWRNWK